MTIHGCRTCGAALTVPVSRVALPVHAHQRYGNGPGPLDPVLEAGTFAVDPLPSGSPWRRWAELEAGEAEALGWYAPRFSISDGPAGQVLLAPGDVRGAVIDPALVGDSACCGLDGGEPNMVCVTCGTPVATRIDDCGLWQAVWLDPLTTRVIEEVQALLGLFSGPRLGSEPQRLPRPHLARLPAQPGGEPLGQRQMQLVPVTLIPPPHLPLRVPAVQQCPHGAPEVAEEHDPTRWGRRFVRIVVWTVWPVRQLPEREVTFGDALDPAEGADPAVRELHLDPPHQRRQRISDRRLGTSDILLGRRRGQ
ncbi:hypothetical protein AB0H83_45995 [Dactylosporangium sp. NPDC050688]|uniref:hypothetical protein n=1 Tax=Dactylosporangium sp. NPDC050688 TaxID=3157217 RepID=UPI0033DED93E